MGGALEPSLLDAATLEALRRIARPISFAPGAALMRQGEPARGAYLIESGEVEACVSLPGGGELSLATLGPGSMLGEMALLEQGIVSATVLARSPVNSLLIDRDDFRALAAQRDAAIAAIQHTVCLALAKKLRALNEKVLACDAPEDAPAAPDAACDPLEGVPRRRAASFDYRRFLPLLAVFSEFGTDDIDEVVARSKVLELPRGHGVFAAGQPAGASYIVVRGALEITARRSASGRSARLAIAPPGEWVGVLSQLEGLPLHGSSARAREATVLLEVERAVFQALYGAGDTTSSRVQRAIHRSLLQSLRRTNNHLTRLISQARVRSRRDALELETALYGQLCHAGAS